MSTATRSTFQIVVTFICLWLALAGAPSSRASGEPPPEAKPPFTRAEVVRMTSNQFIEAYNKRGINVTEATEDTASYFYADVKMDLHDQQAARVSPAVHSKLRWIRNRLRKAEWDAFDASWDVMAMGTMNVHMFRHTFAEEEDAMGELLPSLHAHGGDRRSTKNLLRRLAALDYRISGKARVYHKLARAFAGLSDETLRGILKHEQDIVDLLAAFRNTD